MNCLIGYVVVVFICAWADVLTAFGFPVNKPRTRQKRDKGHGAFIQRRQPLTVYSLLSTSGHTPVLGENSVKIETPESMRFSQRINVVGQNSSVDDNVRAKARETLLGDEDIVSMQRKRHLAAQLRRAAEQAAAATSIPSESAVSANNTLQDERRLTNEEFLTIANSRRAKVLDFEADLLELRAQRHKTLAEGAQLDNSGFPVCNIFKIGPVEVVPTLDEVRHRVDHTVTAQLTGRSLTIFQKKRPRLTYDIESITLPIFNVPDTGETCWGFNYHSVDQLFCSTNKVSRDSWIDAVTEAWFCQSEGLQGMLPSVQATEEEMLTKEKVVKPTPAPKNPDELEPQPLIDINVSMDKQSRPNVTINGKPLTSPKK